MGRKPSYWVKGAKSGRKAVPNKCLLPLYDVEEKVRSRGSKNKKGLNKDEKMQLLQDCTINEMTASEADFVYFKGLANMICVSKEDQHISYDALPELIGLLFVMFCARKQLPSKSGGGVEGIVCQVVQRILTGEENRYVRGGKNMTAENKRVKRVFGYTFDDHKTFADLDAKLTTLRRTSYLNSSSYLYDDQESDLETMIGSRPGSSHMHVKQEYYYAVPFVKEESSYQRPSNNNQSSIPFVKTEPIYQEHEQVCTGNASDDSTCSFFESETASISNEDECFEEAAAAVSAIIIKEEEFPVFFPLLPMDVSMQCVNCGMNEAVLDQHCCFCALQLFNL